MNYNIYATYTELEPLFVEKMHEFHIFSRVLATLQPALYVGRSSGWSVGHTLFLYHFYFF